MRVASQRKVSKGKSDSRYLARLLPTTLKDVYNPTISLSSSSRFFILLLLSLYSSIPHSTLIYINPLDYSLFSYYSEFRAFLLLSSVLHSSLFASQSIFLITLEYDPLPTLTLQPLTIPSQSTQVFCCRYPYFSALLLSS